MSNRSVTLVKAARHANWAPMSAKVTCTGCTHAFNARTGALTVDQLRAGSRITVAITSRPAGSASSRYLTRTWKHAWTVAR